LPPSTGQDFFRFLGMSIVEVSPEQAVLRMDVPREFRSPFDRVHGGAIAALIDTAGGAIVAVNLPPNGRTATHEINVNYVSFAAEHTLLCTARVIGMGRSVATVEAEVRTEAGRLVAKALGAFGVFPGKDAAATSPSRTAAPRPRGARRRRSGTRRTAK
jgi:acyl-CoA thioesterase